MRFDETLATRFPLISKYLRRKGARGDDALMACKRARNTSYTSCKAKGKWKQQRECGTRSYWRELRPSIAGTSVIKFELA